MVYEYECKSCGLYFALGWYHGHGVGEDGFLSQTFLVCMDCGTPHAIRRLVAARELDELRELANNVKHEELRESVFRLYARAREFKEFETRVVGQPGPAFDRESAMKNRSAEVEAKVAPPTRRKPAEEAGDAAPAEHKMHPMDITCVHCGTKGSLIHEWYYAEMPKDPLRWPVRWGRALGLLRERTPVPDRRVQGPCPNCKKEKVILRHFWRT